VLWHAALLPTILASRRPHESYGVGNALHETLENNGKHNGTIFATPNYSRKDFPQD
jgi:hypothetical protein